jgi:Ca2+-binding RTX toxin-like protein
MATITGTSGNDFLRGTTSSDLILGLAGRDVLLGLAGNDTLRGGDSADTLDGGNGRDTLQGESGVDMLMGSLGNDLLDGGASNFDTANYSDFSTAITLEAAGVVNKGSAGTDQILAIERIIGAAGQANSIDGSTNNGSTSFAIDLGANSLTVRDIPGIGSPSFVVENFVNVTGTSQGDDITGNSGNNILQGGDGSDSFGGSAGNDTIAGNDLAGTEDNNNDTIDYTGLGAAITLLPTGTINKGSLGTDQLNRVETIIGEAGQDNVISAAGNSGASINVDLAAESLQVNIVTPRLTLNRTVTNFVDVVGSQRRDSIRDNSLDNSLAGGSGNDTIQSSGGNDVINGNGGNDTIIADIGQDTLTGGSGTGIDTFVLGSGSSISFDDAGSSDFATLSDFQSGIDRLQLAGNASLYSVLKTTGNSLISEDTNNNGTFDNSDELIARVNGSFDFTTDVTFV